MSDLDKLKDTGAERALLGTIIKYGKNALIETEGIVDSTDFALPINRAIFQCCRDLVNDSNQEVIDLESVKLKAKTLGISDFFTNKKAIEYLELLTDFSFDQSNIPNFALQIKKYSIVRDLYTRYTDAIKYLGSIQGNEPLSEIIAKAEGQIVDFISGSTGTDKLESLADNLEEYIKWCLEQDIVDQIGIPSGFPLWDDAIGGGLRRGAIAVKASRSKVGKSWLALNMGLNVAKRGIPVLLLDTELTKDYQRNRLVCINSGCPIYQFETRKFKEDKDLTQKVLESSKEIDNLPLDYLSISGMSHTEALALVRRWIVKRVGFNKEGKANDCLVIYDYIKLTSGASLTKVTPEYIVLGLMLTEMHNFAVKYDIPMSAYVQLNRDGIDGDDTSIIAGSDRILWLCSSLSFFRNKDQTDIAMGCGYDKGNKKLIILETRHGSGLEIEGDYINLHASLKPNISKFDACGLIREGYKFSDVSTGPDPNSQQINPPREAGGDSRESK